MLIRKNRSSAGLDTATAMTATRKVAVVGRTVRGLGDLSNGLGDLSDQTVVVDGGLDLGPGLDLCPYHDPDHGRDPPVVEKGVITSSMVPMVAGNKKKKRSGVSRATSTKTHMCDNCQGTDREIKKIRERPLIKS